MIDEFSMKILRKVREDIAGLETAHNDIMIAMSQFETQYVTLNKKVDTWSRQLIQALTRLDQIIDSEEV